MYNKLNNFKHNKKKIKIKPYVFNNNKQSAEIILTNFGNLHYE